MKLSKLLPMNGFIFLALGIGFTLYGPNVLAYFGVQDISGLEVDVYWTVVGFARMFGAILITFGLVLTGLRSLFLESPDVGQARREILFSLVLGMVISTIAALTQQASVWGTLAGWALTGLFLILTILYIFLLARRV